MQVIDFHTHVFPNRLEKMGQIDQIAKFRKLARHWLKPFSAYFHESQTFLRVIPESLRKPIDEIGMLAPLAGLLFESSVKDLKESMLEAGVDYAVLIAQPPYLPNDHLMEICQDHPELIPAVNIPSGTTKPGSTLKSLHKKGAKILKIHPAMDGEGVESSRYRALLKSANELGMPVILHTGCVHSHVLYKDPSQGKAERFAPWFANYPELKFILAHMNIHEPNIALDLAEEYSNVQVDTSWQPAETIGEAVRRIGSDRVLFGSDWPLVGNNMTIGLKRVRECISMGMITEEQSRQVLGENALKLLNFAGKDVV
jgi:predicted TIM-barrel fold metal-dependent hydrolase